LNHDDISSLKQEFISIIFLSSPFALALSTSLRH